MEAALAKPVAAVGQADGPDEGADAADRVEPVGVELVEAETLDDGGRVRIDGRDDHHGQQGSHEVSVEAPVGECFDYVPREDGPAVPQGLCGVVAHDARDNDGALARGEERDGPSAQDGPGLCCAVREVQVRGDGEDAGQDSL